MLAFSGHLFDAVIIVPPYGNGFVRDLHGRSARLIFADIMIDMHSQT